LNPHCSYFQGDYANGLLVMHEAKRLFTDLSNPKGVGVCNNNIANMLFMQVGRQAVEAE
jgi:hypothetical protein